MGLEHPREGLSLRAQKLIWSFPVLREFGQVLIWLSLEPDWFWMKLFTRLAYCH